MFGLAGHLIAEATDIARGMSASGEVIVPLRDTGLFVAREVGGNHLDLHEFTVDGTSYHIVHQHEPR